MAHRHEHLCSTSQLWLPHPALCIVLPECFQGLCVWSRAVGSKSSKLQNIADRDPQSPDFHVFFHSGTTPLILLKTSVSHPSNFFWCSGTTLFQLPHPGTPSNSSGFFPFLETSIFGNVIHAHPFQTPWVAPMTSPLTGTLGYRVVGLESRLGEKLLSSQSFIPPTISFLSGCI